MDCHLERSEAPAERSRKTPLLLRGSYEKQTCISITNRATPGTARVAHPNLAFFARLGC